MAGRRLPALAFLAAFLVAFNVFSSHGDDASLPHHTRGAPAVHHRMLGDADLNLDVLGTAGLLDAVEHIGTSGGGWTRERSAAAKELAARARYEGMDPSGVDASNSIGDVIVDADTGRRKKRVVKRIVRKVRRNPDGTTTVISEKEEHPTDVITNAHRSSSSKTTTTTQVKTPVTTNDAAGADARGDDVETVAWAKASGLKIETRRVGNTLEPFEPTHKSNSWFGSSKPKKKADVVSSDDSSGEGSSGSSGSHQSTYAPKEHTEYGGDVVKWGETNLKNSPKECYDDCAALSDAKHNGGCNVWVYCPVVGGCSGQPHKACWLKRQGRPEIPTGTSDDTNPWISGSMAKPADTSGERGAHKKFHVLVTTNANIYQAWQVRVMHFWYNKMKKQCEAEDPDGCQMGGFTRVLHDKADKLVDEIPTCVVDRLDNEMGFVVLSRPNAFKQYFEKCGDIEEDYILMAEPDHLYLRPLQNLMNGRTAAAFPFFYINPKGFPELIRRFAGEHLTDREIEEMDPIGSSPVFIHKEDLRRVAPVWHDVTLKIKRDKEADKAWGWVLEMYGYTIAAKIAGVKHDLRPKLMAQPPWDKGLGEFFILHFTYGNDYDENGVFTPGKVGKWRFDKRSYMAGIPPKNLDPPPSGCDNELVKRLIEMMNEASATLPNWEDPLGAGRGAGRRMLRAGWLDNVPAHGSIGRRPAPIPIHSGAEL